MMGNKTPAKPEMGFILLMAFLMSMTALAIDAMLASIGSIATELVPDFRNRAALVVGVFILGMGLGTPFAGPLSDRFGRRASVIGGLLGYILGAMICYFAQSIEILFVGRFVQGFAASAPRVTIVAIIRDRFSGRQMARAQSLVAMFFTLVPGIAPLLGAVVDDIWGWRAVFLTFVGAGLIALTWFSLQQQETLPVANRRSFGLQSIFDGWIQTLRVRVVWTSIVLQACVYSILLMTLSLTPRVFEDYFNNFDLFPYVLGGSSLVGATTSFVNSQIVERFGMVKIIQWAVCAQVAITGGMIFVFYVLPDGSFTLPIFTLWLMSVFLIIGFTIGNTTALAMAPLGHIAGAAASTMSAVTSIISATTASILVQLYSGSTGLLLVASFLAAVTAVAISYTMTPDAD